MGGADRGSESETGADVVPSPHEPRRAAGAYDFPVDLGDLASAPGLIARHVPPGATVLDVGCASANLLVALRTDRGCPGVGLEIDSDAVAAARAKDVEVHDTDLAQDPLGRHLDGRRFDRVILADVLEHLVDPASVLGQVPGLLAPGGQVLVSVPNITHVDVILALAQDRFAYTPTGLLDRTHLRFFTLATFTEMAQACGLAVVGVERHIAPPLQTELWGGQSDLPRRYVAMLEQAVRAGNPNADVYQFIVVLEPRSIPVAAVEASASGPVGRPDSTPELTLIGRSAAGRASPAEPARAAAGPPAPEGAAPIQRVRLDPARPFGPALLAALDGVQGRACAVVDDGAACDPGLLHALRRAVQSDPELVAACSGPVAADDLAPPVARAPGDAITTALPRWARARLLTTPSLPLHGIVVRTSALRLAVQSVAALGPPFLAALDDWTVVARLLQWGDVGVVGAPGPGAPAPSPESDLPLAIAVSLSPLRPDEIMPPAPRAADGGAVPTPLVGLGPSPAPSRRSWLRRGPKP